MTTNSPNPVDGDVQALIEHCKENIDTLTVALKHCDQEEADEIYRNLELQKVALAALTAEPEYNTSNEGGEIFLEVSKAEYDKCHDDYRWISYPAPPAQLLRPVELPVVKTARSNWSTWNWIEHLGGRFQNGNPGDYIEFGSVYAVSQMLKQYRRTVTAEVISEISESLRQQGYEVKS